MERQWFCRELRRYGYFRSVWLVGDSYQMWVVGNIHDNADLIEANTRLIAAVPEMLAALQEIVRQHGLDADNTLLPPIPNRWMDAISKAEKAINKALGR